jgi:hypothetical protein
MKLNLTRRASLAGLLALGAPSLSFAAAGAKSAFDKDREAILKMAGDFKVRFDARETVSFLDDYNPANPSISVGNEIVRVIEDTGRTIRLQHLLVVEQGGQTFIVKHWRHDWIYEPASVLVNVAQEEWRLAPISGAARKGGWTQTVWQPDDSPRYGQIGRWAHDDGVSRWTSLETRRPLALRDVERKPPYDHYEGVNRHAITPTGWVHEQNNAKVGMRNGAEQTVVHEVVLNSYDRTTNFQIAKAEAYLNATSDYWKQVRADWETSVAKNRGVRFAAGANKDLPLLGLSDQIAAGKLDTRAALTQAAEIMQGLTKA